MATALLTILLSLNDGVVVSMHASGQVALFGPVRLFYCLGLILAGFVADRKQRRLLPISTLFMQLFTILLPALLGNALYHSNMALMYFCSGFYVIFFTVSFLAFAPDTKDPALWASMGRAVRSLTTAIVVTPIPLLFARFGSLGMTALSCLLVAALLPVVWLCRTAASIGRCRKVRPISLPPGKPIKSPFLRNIALPPGNRRYLPA